MRTPVQNQVYVWDPFVRLFHWTFGCSFTVAYFTEDDLLTVHVWVGYVVGGMVVARVVWGFIGPARARSLMWTACKWPTAGSRIALR